MLKRKIDSIIDSIEDLYYFNSKKQGEVDFLIEGIDGTSIPIEVKSGKDYEKHNALNNLLSNADYDIKMAYVLCNDNVSVQDKRVYLPVYMTTFIRKKKETRSVYRLDLNGLRSNQANRPTKTTTKETTPLRHFQKTSTFVIGLSILIYDSDTDFIRIDNQFTCIGTDWLAGRKTTDWIRVGISALNPDHTVDWSYHYTLV